MGSCVSTRLAAFGLALGLVLALPAQASAHGRGPTVALDYRFRLAPAPAGVHVRILDGDRSLRVAVDPSTSLLIRGYLREPMLRFDAGGVYVNAASPSAQADRLVQAGLGWRRLAGGSSYAWHDHRLAPGGERGRFVIGASVNGRPARIVGSYVRVARPAVWPWVLGAAVFIGGVALAARRRAVRSRVTVALGVAAGLAALATTIAFALRDQPTGGVGWVTIGMAAAVAIGLAFALVRLDGRARAYLAGVTGAVAAAVSLSSLPVFWHGVVISALPANATRLGCALALLAGASAAALSLLREAE